MENGFKSGDCAPRLSISEPYAARSGFDLAIQPLRFERTAQRVRLGPVRRNRLQAVDRADVNASLNNPVIQTFERSGLFLKVSPALVCTRAAGIGGELHAYPV